MQVRPLLLLLLAIAPALAQDKPSEKVKKAFPDATRAALESADELEVLALICERQPKSGEDVFRGYPVTKRVKVEAKDRAAVIAAIFKGVDEGGPIAKCFEPHHGIHAKQGDKTVDLVICYRCIQLVVHDGSGRGRTVPTSKSSENALAKILGEETKPEVKVEAKSYDGKTVQEWTDLVMAAKVRRHGGKLPEELEPAVLALAKAVKDDPDPTTRTRAAAALGRLHDKGAPAASVIAEALAAAKDRRDRFNALNLLASYGAHAAPAVPALIEMLEKSQGQADSLQLRVVDVLGSIGPKATVAAPALLEWSKPERGDSNVVQGALALAKIGAKDDATVDALLARTEGAKWNVKRALLQALGDLKAEKAKAALEKAAEDADARVQLTAKVALAQLKGDSAAAFAEVEKALAPDSEQVLRRLSVGDLRRTGGAKAVTLLAKLLDDADDWIRQAAASELGELGPAAKEALPALEKALAASVPRTPLRDRLEEAVDRVRE